MSPKTGALLMAAALVLGTELFVPPIVGLANNGDFARVTGWLSLGPKENGWADNFIHVAGKYVKAPGYRWTSGVYSSEVLLARIATWLKPGEFDIRQMGVVHALLFLLALYVLLQCKDIPGKAVIASFAILVFTDVSYAAYFNSFYMDAAAFLGLLLMVVLALAENVWGFTAAALLFILSKPQHGIFGVLPAAYLLFVKKREVAAAVVLAATVLCPFTFPSLVRQQALFNVIFLKIVNKSPHAEGDLRELGLTPDYLRYAGQTAFSPGSLGNDPAFLAQLEGRSGFRKLLWFYAEHPIRTLEILRDDLVTQASVIRPPNLNNRLREDATAPDTKFRLWSTLRSALYRWWPWHIVAWLAALTGLAAFLLRREATRHASMLCIGMVAMAAGEFVLASLSDAVETYRHLFLFHAITDLTICFALGYLLSFRHVRLT